MGRVSPRWLITARELSDELHSSLSPAPVILDVRWTLAGSDPDGYADAHIPGAAFVNLDRELAGPPGERGRHPLPDPLDLQIAWRAAGIDEVSRVVVYDGGPGPAAARAWWLLRWSGLTQVRFLDGGFAAWRAAGFPVASGPPAVRALGSVTVRAGGMPVVGIDEAAELAADPSGVLLDARAAPRFRGEMEPLDPVAGHIPGSINLPSSDLVDADGFFRPAAELVGVFGAHAVRAGGGAATPGRAAASCGSGITACQLVLAGAVIGLDLALYPGSYSQWCAAGRPVAVGP
jgi:thiosulfate/3-mercaptopyruvate sulfurtransferase